MCTVKEVRDALFELAPIDAKMDFDNVGLLAGDSRRQVNSILVALDVTGEVIEEALDTGADLIVTHHPLLFSEKSVTDESITGKLILSLLENKLSAICMHTNLDAARGGVGDALARACGLSNTELLCAEGRYPDGSPYSYGRIGTLDTATALRDYLSLLMSSLRTNGLRYHSSGKPVSRIAVVGGSGGSYLETAFDLGCDTLVTADVKYDVFLAARELGINLIDADHFCTENTVIPELCRYLSERFPSVSCSVSARHGQTSRFFV